MTMSVPDLAFRPGTDICSVAPGQIVKALSGNTRISVEGTLSAEGTRDAPIVFTSPLDDALGGDTNNDGEASAPSPGNWQGIALSGLAAMDFVEVRYAGNSNSSFDSALHVGGGTLTAESLRVELSSTTGTSCDGAGSLTADNVIFSRNAREGLRAFGGCTVTLTNGTLSNNRVGVDARDSMVVLTNMNVTYSSTRALQVFSGGTIDLAFSNLFETASVTNLDDPIGSNGNISGDPRFVDAEGGDYRLLDGSVAIDAADGGAAPSRDFFGNDRYDNPAVADTGTGPLTFVDMGAIERQDGLPGPLLAIGEGGPGDRIGASVAVDGNRVAVGMPGADVDGVDDGRVIIYELAGVVFVQVAVIEVPETFFAVNFGSAVDLSGDFVAIGAAGTSLKRAALLPQAKGGGTEAMQAAIFERAGQQWTLKTVLTPTGGSSGDGFGSSIALTGDTVMVGAPGDDQGGADAGAAYLYRFSGSSVIDDEKLLPPNATPSGGFGAAVDAQDQWFAAGAPGGQVGAAVTGSVSLFQQVGTNLSEVAELATKTGTSSGTGDQFGTSIAIGGEQLLVGAPMADEGGTDTGAAFVFDLGASLVERMQVTADSGANGAELGRAVAFSSDGVVIGAPGLNGGAGAVLRFDGEARQIERIDGPSGTTGFGETVAHGSNVLAVGAPDTASDRGEAFTRLVNDLILFVDRFE